MEKIIKETTTAVVELLEKIGCATSDFTEHEIKMLEKLTTSGITIKCVGANYIYTLEDVKIIERAKPTTCVGCPVLFDNNECPSVDHCGSRNEYDIVRGVRAIGAHLRDVPFKIYYSSPYYTLVCGEKRIYANSLNYMGFVRMADYTAPPECEGVLPPGKYIVETDVSRANSLNLGYVSFEVNGTEYSGLIRQGRWRPYENSIRATVYFEIMKSGDVFIPLIIEPGVEGVTV